MRGYNVCHHTSDGTLLAISLCQSNIDEAKPGVDFITDRTLSQQLAIISQPKGHVIPRHVHLLSPREVKYTQETLVIVRGCLQIELYDSNKNLVESLTLGAGDIILLVSGGHGFTVLENCLIIEVKQGPFDAQHDKERF